MSFHIKDGFRVEFVAYYDELMQNGALISCILIIRPISHCTSLTVTDIN